MMQGVFKEYNWSDVMRLVFKDAGLNDDASARMRGEAWFVNGFHPPQHEKDTCIRLQVYDKPFSERIKEHCDGT